MNRSFPLILDGAMGTQLYKAGLPRGYCPEKWVLENPEAAIKIQKAYVDAGSQVIYAPTFGANAAVLEKHGINGKVEEYNIALVKLARTASDGRALVAGDISSIGAMLYPMGNMRFEDIFEIYREQAAALEKAGVDLFAIETMTNVAEARAAMLAVKSVSQKPVFVSFSCDENGKTMMGTDVCAALQILQGMGADAFGLNCSTGPDKMLPQIKRLAEYAHIPLIAKPNAGLPKTVDGSTVYTVNAEQFAEYIPALAEAGAGIFGACCGSDEKFIAAIKQKLNGIQLKTAAASAAFLPCATEKNIFPLETSAPCEQVFFCDEELEDNLYELEEGELFGIRITGPEDVAVFSDVQYAIKNPLCIFCDDAGLLEKTLRAYQGRVLYSGTLPKDALLPLVEKYGLIVSNA